MVPLFVEPFSEADVPLSSEQAEIQSTDAVNPRGTARRLIDIRENI
jgi:hypothetical protein